MRQDRRLSWRQGSRPQPVNQAQDLSEESFGDGDLCELECDVAAMSHDLGAGRNRPAEASISLHPAGTPIPSPQHRFKILILISKILLKGFQIAIYLGTPGL